MRRKKKNIKHPKLELDSVCFQHIVLLCHKMRHQAAVSVIFMGHLSSLRSILLLSIPAARMSTMSSAVRPRRSSSCLTDRGRGPAASAVSSRPVWSICRSEFQPSLLRMLDEMMWTWASLWPSNQRGERNQFCAQENMQWNGKVKRLFTRLLQWRRFFLLCDLDSCSHHSLNMNSYDSCLQMNIKCNTSPHTGTWTDIMKLQRLFFFFNCIQLIVIYLKYCVISYLWL